MITIVALSLLLFVLANFAMSARPDQGKAAPVTGTPADAKAAKWKELGTPGAAHQLLNPRVGKWSVVMKMFESAGAVPLTSKGTTEVKWIMDGRHIQETVTAEWMGQPFSGVGTTGYDNLKQKYVGSWIDNMSTGLMHSEGTYDAATKTFSYASECPDVLTGKYARSRTLVKLVDADHLTMQTFKAGADGKDFLTMQLDYVRAR